VRIQFEIQSVSTSICDVIYRPGFWVSVPLGNVSLEPLTVRESKKPDKIPNTYKIFEYLSDADDLLFAHARQ
jgi:hypothetical protein